MYHTYLKYLVTFLLLLVIITSTKAQTGTISLEECYQLARANYPAIKKLDLITRTSEYDMENANKRFLPQITFSGQANYQSETLSFPKALGTQGLILPSISNDQYRIQGEINQDIYDGGSVHHQKDIIRANRDLQEQNIEANLYAIKSRINNIYFSVLLIDAQLKQNQLNQANLETQGQKTEAALKNGVAFRSSLDELKAEIVNIKIAGTEYEANRTAYLNMLSLFIGKELPASTQLQVPLADYPRGEINRPELKAFDLQKSIYTAQEKQLKSDYMPRVSAFLQGAYGRPTLNIIENKFGPWYIAGLRLNWSLASLYTLSNKKSILNLNSQLVDADKQIFLLNTEIDLRQQDGQVSKFIKLIQQDEEAIALRGLITNSAQAQLTNGIITTHEYLQKVNMENLARQTKILHQMQLLQAKYNQKFLTGN